ADEVRVVVPSRSGLLQSSVNVKLLKKAAKDSRKKLVLVTSDKITKNLAGVSGVAVASSVKAMAHVPDSLSEDSTAGSEEKNLDKLQVVTPEEAGEPKQPKKI
ncbi:MAG: hypothetical protein LC101_11310, partial [Flavobacteriales bacterium]|nr:hypothetical protein [Flavobacteriales bacterium]